jgi:toxin YhaV
VEPWSCYGWNIYLHPLFDRQFRELTKEVKALKLKLSIKDFQKHPKTKMLAALKRAITEEIPTKPYDSRFVLTGSLKEYGRLKKLGLNSRYRLFFKVFPETKGIVIIWLGFPRRDGDKKDCYIQFKKKVSHTSNMTLDELLNEQFSL